MTQLDDRLAAAETLADIAKIPPDRRAAFCEKASVLISRADIDARRRKSPRIMALRGQFKELEAAINATNRALAGLSDLGQFIFAGKLWAAHQSLHLRFPDDPIWLSESREQAWFRARRGMRAKALAAGWLANKQPGRKKGKGGSQNWIFLAFVRALWHCADRHGGKLTASCKNNVGSGSMFRALEALRPYFAATPEAADSIWSGLPAADFIRSGLLTQAIADTVNAERKKAHRH
jgi:hypothetical protein